MRPESGDPNDCPEASPLMRSKVRAYSHQGHGPRADQQAGYISATSDSTASLANCSRSMHIGSVGGTLAGTWGTGPDADSSPGDWSRRNFPHFDPSVRQYVDRYWPASYQH